MARSDTQEIFEVPKWPRYKYSRICKDWENKDAYAEYKKLEKFELAWEFERRKPNYIRAYKNFLKDIEFAKSNGKSSDEIIDIEFKHCDARNLEQMYDPSLSALQIRKLRAERPDENLDWNIWQKPDVAGEVTTVEEFEELRGMYPQRTYPEQFIQEIQPFLIIGFDARCTIDHLLKEARLKLESKQAQLAAMEMTLTATKQVPLEKMPTYLQIIDALIRKAKPKQILQAIFPDSNLESSDYDKIRHNIRSALKHLYLNHHLLRI